MSDMKVFALERRVRELEAWQEDVKDFLSKLAVSLGAYPPNLLPLEKYCAKCGAGMPEACVCK